MSRYQSAAIALDFVSDNMDALLRQTLRFVPQEQVHLLHVVRLTGCNEGDGFEASGLEQEYWRCDAQIKSMGQAAGIPPDRQSLLVGPVTERISEFVTHQGVGLLVLGRLDENDPGNYPIDVLSGALHSANCDLLIVDSA